MQDDTGKIQGIVCVAQDITERKRAEMARRDNERQMRLIIDSAHTAFIAINSKGSITEWNPRAEKIFGWSRHEAVGNMVAELIIPSEFREAHGEGLAHFLETGEEAVLNKMLELRARHRNGNEFPVELSISPLNIGGEFFFNAFLQDITERKRAEEELRRSRDAAEAANQAKSEFLANMSHEIRTPLHGILSFARFGTDKALTAEPQKLLDYFEKIDISGQRLLVLLSDILDLAKMESGSLQYEFKPANLHAVLRSVQNEFDSLLTDRNISNDYAEPDSELRLTLDENRIAQVMRNLLSNAAKFSPDGGTIRIDVNEDDEGVRVSIRDHGIGVPADELETVFDKFVQSSKTRTGAGGTGLGLSICREIVEAHQGRIWCENHPEGGAVFHVVLPRTMQGGSWEERGKPRGVKKTEETTEQAPAIGIS